MNTYSVAIYFLVTVVSTGIALALYFRFRDAILDFESKITGIWSNESDTMRILIYSLETRFQAEVVWTNSINQQILGSGIIRDMSLNYFSWGKGTYIDPFTKRHFNFTLRLKNTGRLRFQLFEKSNRDLAKVEEWKQVH